MGDRLSRGLCPESTVQIHTTKERPVPRMGLDPSVAVFERIADIAVECFGVLITGGNHSFRLYVPYFP